MSVEGKKNSAEEIGTLSSCLIEGNPEQKARERKIKRRALAISIVLQSVAIVALVLVPLLGHTEKIAYRVVTPMPPYHAPRVRAETRVQQPIPDGRRVCLVCFNRPLSSSPVTTDTHRLTSNLIDDVPYIGVPGGSGEPTGSDIFNSGTGPRAPEDPSRNQRKRISVGGTVQQAMLTRRIEPSYPPLARQLRISGQVHLRAIISTDGSIESLQVMDGHPLLVQSAMNAVRQWRYQATKLNGQPVEVETIITVVYTLNQ